MDTKYRTYCRYHLAVHIRANFIPESNFANWDFKSVHLDFRDHSRFQNRPIGIQSHKTSHKHKHPIYLLWFWTKPEEFAFQLKVGNQLFRYFIIGSITRASVYSGLKLNPGLKPNLKPDQINWVLGASGT